MDGRMPVTIARSSTPTIPILRPRIHQEVIDVDGLDDEQTQRPSRRPRRPIQRDNPSIVTVSSDVIVLDSDDGIEAGPPTRRRPPDVIRPNVEPFAFERVMATHEARPASHPPPGNAPPSRHRPVISLGGGFISLTYQREAELLQRQQAQEQARQRYFDRLRIARGIHQRHGFLSQTIGRIFPTWLFGDPTEEEMVDALAFSELTAAEAGQSGFGNDRVQPRRAPHEYRVAYTHPYPPTPGFTHNFESPSPSVAVIDVDEDPGPSTKSTGSSSANKGEDLNTLVCARCLDPLVLGGSNMSEKERTGRRLWGLRCGHILDGKCIVGSTDVEVVSFESPHDKLQGQDALTIPQSQASAHGPLLSNVQPLDAKPSTRSAKARGKTRVIDHPSEPSRPTEETREQAVSPENTSIRSRLRPRNTAGHVARISSSLPLSSNAPPQPSTQRTAASGNPIAPSVPLSNTTHQSKRRSKGKGKQKAVEPLILQRYEWRCPVALCERLHLSLHIESQGWVMDETQGAVPIFA
ncbi:hypothetical protein B0F90DRAFT_1669936 [Multifurca ochricompacta]|uniref:Uncharacterized protein n=1 Tax=Multifurca ochricompacta TaxID=376703 RepID=A0AAD4LZ77_9AGAM|nr:hypothetical protein B0F90DRAFT_1669936 [Multifurca ochricompacta]